LVGVFVCNTGVLVGAPGDTNPARSGMTKRELSGTLSPKAGVKPNTVL